MTGRVNATSPYHTIVRLPGGRKPTTLRTWALQQVVGYLRYTGREANVVAKAARDPNVWSGRALQEVFVDLSALRSCINVSGPLTGACCAPGHHGYQRACGLISRQASNGPFGSPGFAGAGKTGPHLVSSSRRPRQGNGTMSSLSPDRRSSFVRAARPFLRPGLHVARGIARRDRQGWPSQLPLFLLQRLQATP